MPLPESIGANMHGARFLGMDSAVLGLGTLGCDCCTVRDFATDPYTRGCHVALVPTPARLKLLHACA
jgi:hypothetical protein